MVVCRNGVNKNKYSCSRRQSSCRLARALSFPKTMTDKPKRNFKRPMTFIILNKSFWPKTVTRIEMRCHLSRLIRIQTRKSPSLNPPSPSQDYRQIKRKLDVFEFPERRRGEGRGLENRRILTNDEMWSDPGPTKTNSSKRFNNYYYSVLPPFIRPSVKIRIWILYKVIIVRQKSWEITIKVV